MSITNIKPKKKVFEKILQKYDFLNNIYIIKLDKRFQLS